MRFHPRYLLQERLLWAGSSGGSLATWPNIDIWFLKTILEETDVEKETKFRGYNKLYSKAVETEYQLSIETAPGLASQIYQELKSSHEKYQC